MVKKPKWQEDLATYENIKSTFILSGNVHDKQFVFSESGDCRLRKMDSLLYWYFNEMLGYSTVVFYNRVDGFHSLRPDQDKVIAEKCEKWLEKGGRSRKTSSSGDCSQDYTFESASVVIREAMRDPSSPVAVVFDMATSAVKSPTNLTDDEQTAFSRLLMSSKEMRFSIDPESGKRLSSCLVFVVDKVNDLPSWFFVNNPYVKTLSVTPPDRDQRFGYISQALRDTEYFGGLETATEEETEKFIGNLSNLTEGFSCMELEGFLTKCKDEGVKATEINHAVSEFRYGRADNLWERVDGRTIEDAEVSMRRRIKGQDQAIEQAVSILYRAASGMSLSASQAGSAKPKGILFLAGPTGTGKTELAKAITEALFSDEAQMIRFDMSEFGKSQSDQRLFGAPPGYVGYEAGGELTNAVKEKPFSVLLFDEIEKADPSIFDKFLQILDDGRLTDSHGETVYFGETIIIFTSNYGMSERDPISNRNTKIITPDTYGTYDDLKSAVLDNIRSADKSVFRPEFINRIGENFVVFNFISMQIAEEIARAKLASFARRVQLEKNITLFMSWDYYDELLAEIEKNLDMGGRGVLNMLEIHFLNPLSKTIFLNSFTKGERLVLTGKSSEANGALKGMLSYTIGLPSPDEAFFLEDEKAQRPPCSLGEDGQS